MGFDYFTVSISYLKSILSIKLKCILKPGNVSIVHDKTLPLRTLWQLEETVRRRDELVFTLI